MRRSSQCIIVVHKIIISLLLSYVTRRAPILDKPIMSDYRRIQLLEES